MKNSKLFPNSERARRHRQQAERAKEVLKQMERLTRSPNDQTFSQLESKAQELNRLVGSGFGTGFTREMVRSVRDLMRATAHRPASGIVQFLRGLGINSSNIGRWFRSYEGQEVLKPVAQQIERAISVFDQIDPEAFGLGASPESAGGQRIPTPPPSGRNRIESEFVRESDDSSQAAEEIHRNVTVLPDGRWRIRGPGYDRAMTPDDDLLTGRMIPVRSSNVHSIGFEFNLDRPLKSRLIIRYLQQDRSGATSGKVPGPTYAYRDVHPDFFNDLKLASSKGKWVWDELRIRGTIAGHQFSYNLIRAAQDYLPRRARVHRGRQVLVRRRKTGVRRDGSTVRLTSPLPTRTVGPYRPTAERPNVGNPDRGRRR